MASKKITLTTYHQLKSTVSRQFNSCSDYGTNVAALNDHDLSLSMVGRLETLLDKVDTTFSRLEGMLIDVSSLLSEEAGLQEIQFIDDFSRNLDGLRKEVLHLCRKIRRSTSTSPQASSEGTNRTTVKINEALKPEKLLCSSTLAEFRSWKTNFNLYFSSNQMDKFPLPEQQGYLRSCLELKLQQMLMTKSKDTTPIHGDTGCVELLREIFLQNTPVLTRRYNFFQCNQKHGERFSDWYLRLQLSGQEAELPQNFEDELYVLRFVTGTSDSRLREEFLRQANPSRENLLQIAKAWESAAVVGGTLAMDTPVSLAAVSSYKKQASHKKTYQTPSKSSNSPRISRSGDLMNKCNGCGQPADAHKRIDCPAQGKTCKKCGRLHHFASVCLDGRLQHKSRSQGSHDAKSRAITSTIRVNSLETSHATPLLTISIYPEKGTPFEMLSLPDTGATESLISSDLLQQYNIPISSLQKTSILAANGSRLRCHGSVQLHLRYLDQLNTHVTAYVTPDLQDEFIISWHALIALGVLPKQFPNPVSHSIVCNKLNSNYSDSRSLDLVKSKVSHLFQKYPAVFDSVSVLRAMKGQPMKIHLKDENVKPTHMTTARSIPFAFREKAENEIQYMIKSGIIERVDEPTDWVSPCLIVPKPNGSLRFVVDYTGLNRHVKRPEHPFPSPSDLSSSIPSTAKLFVVLDAVKGYWQVELDQESRALTTFLTPFGRFRYCRAPMGLNASGDEYCARGDRALSGLSGVRKIVDDIIIFASDLDELLVRTKEVLQRCKENSITLSLQKAQIGEKVKFAGFIVSSSGISPNPDKIAAISKFPVPSNVTDLRSFLGLANQLGQFIPDLAHASEPLRGLLKKSTSYQWLCEHQSSFETIKNILTNPNGPVLAHFNPSLPSVLLTDASRLKGLGFALVQTKPDGSTSLIQCGSRFLSDAETRYAVCELESLAIQWAINKCRLYKSSRGRCREINILNPFSCLYLTRFILVNS
jgi:hypothetical protein